MCEGGGMGQWEKWYNYCHGSQTWRNERWNRVISQVYINASRILTALMVKNGKAQPPQVIKCSWIAWCASRNWKDSELGVELLKVQDAYCKERWIIQGVPAQYIEDSSGKKDNPDKEHKKQGVWTMSEYPWRIQLQYQGFCSKTMMLPSQVCNSSII